MAVPNLVNLERVHKSYGVRPLLADVSLGVGAGERIGVVGRNGDGKTTLLRVIGDLAEPDQGRVSRNRGLRLGFLTQGDDLDPAATVREVVLQDLADHEWAGDAGTREVVEVLLAGVDLERPVEGLSGGERRRCSLARLLLGDHDLVVLDEPTNHLDVEAVAWLAQHLARRASALVVVTHDRWFLDEVATTTWEVHDGLVDVYDGGYAAFVLAKAERQRQAAASESRRQNLMRKELAWLRRGAPARTSKPKFRMDAASALIEDEPPRATGWSCSGSPPSGSARTSSTSRTPTWCAASAPCCRTPPGGSARATGSGWSASTGPARPPCCAWSPATWSPPADGSSGAGRSPWST